MNPDIRGQMRQTIAKMKAKPLIRGQMHLQQAIMPQKPRSVFSQQIIKKSAEKEYENDEEGEGQDLKILGLEDKKLGRFDPKHDKIATLVHPGINIQSHCNNYKCESYNELINCPLACDQPWNIPRMIDETVCPACKSHVGNQIENIGYYHCSWTIRGKLKGETNSFFMEGKTKSRQYLRYQLNSSSSEVAYSYLIIQAKAL